jgi:hypothetical protein
MSAPPSVIRIVSVAVSLSAACSNAWGDGVNSAHKKNRESLCAADESIVFSCALKRQRFVSVCASQSLSANSGYVQYRFGKLSKIEIAVPMGAAKGASALSGWRSDVRAYSVMYAGGGGSYLRFNLAPFSYVTYSATGRGWGEKQGVMVLKNDKPLAVHKCVGALTSKQGSAFF